MTTTVAERSRRLSLPTLGLTLLLGLLAGVCVFLVTDALCKTDISGPGWSLRGNGALIVLFAGAPALLALGWVALAERSPIPAITAGVVTLAIELLVGFGPAILGPESLLRLGVVFALLPLALALAAGLLVTRGHGVMQGLGVFIGSVLVSLGIPGLEFVLVPLLIPAVLATPVLAQRWSGWLAVHSLALFVAMVAGQVISTFLFRSS